LECASPRPGRTRLEALLQNPNWARLLELAEAHGIIHLLASRLREANGIKLPQEFRQKLLESQRAQLLSGLGLIAEMIRVLERFGSAGIQALVLKGPALSLQAYGDATARQYGDIDIMVRHRDIFQATQVMVEAGFDAYVPSEVVASGKIPGEYFFSRPNTKVVIEVHTERTLRYFPHRLAVEELFARGIALDFDGHRVPTLSLEDALVAMCTHGAKHFWERLMWIADVAATVARQRGLDWEAAAGIAGRLGAQRIVHTGLLLAADLLNATLPLQVAERARADAGACLLVGKVQTWLPSAEGASGGLLGRAVFRAQMRGGFWPGIRYVTRLSLSPTEEDWREGHEHKRSRYRDSMRRLLRLAGKYGRDSSR
jgi:hypothetical protein